MHSKNQIHTQVFAKAVPRTRGFSKVWGQKSWWRLAIQLESEKKGGASGCKLKVLGHEGCELISVQVQEPGLYLIPRYVREAWGFLAFGYNCIP